MKPVDQTRFYVNDPNEPAAEPPGNCWAACVASILEIPLDDVPDEAQFWTPGCRPWDSWIPYMRHVHQWLFEAHRLVLVEVRCRHLEYAGPIEVFQKLPLILSGQSPRNPKAQHAVVGFGNTIAHDPHPSRDGLRGEPNDWYYEFFAKAT